MVFSTGLIDYLKSHGLKFKFLGYHQYFSFCKNKVHFGLDSRRVLNLNYSKFMFLDLGKSSIQRENLNKNL